MLGLVIALVLINVWISLRIRREFSSIAIRIPLNLIAALLTFVVFWGISPQIFYLYYQLLFDGLPMQWVIRDWFPIRRALSLLLPGNIANSSDLAAGFTLVFLLVHRAVYEVTVVDRTRR